MNSSIIKNLKKEKKKKLKHVKNQEAQNYVAKIVSRSMTLSSFIREIYCVFVYF